MVAGGGADAELVEEDDVDDVDDVDELEEDVLDGVLDGVLGDEPDDVLWAGSVLAETVVTG